MYELILVDAVSVIFVYYKFICMSISFWKYKILYYGYIIYNISIYLWLICCNRLCIKVLSDISEKVFVWKLVDN